MKNFTSLLAVCLLICSTAFTQPGTLDSTFGKDGIKETKINEGGAQSVAIQTDGKIVTGGNGRDNSSSLHFKLVRYNTDGRVDKSFGDNGIATSEFGEAYCNSIAIKKNGNIVAAGSQFYQSSGDDGVLMQCKPDGKLDSSFGKNGKVRTDFGSPSEGISSIAIQADGKIVAGGTATFARPDFILARYKKNGELDSSFGINGKVVTDLGKDDFVSRVLIDEDGNILVAGSSNIWIKDGEFALVRYRHDGKLDSSFGENGKVFTQFKRRDYANSAALQPDGKIVVVGTSNEHFAMARYKHNGELDSSFGDNGKVVNTLNEDETYLTGVVIQPDGKIVAAGYDSYLGVAKFMVVRYNSDGSLDEGFGKKNDNGIVTVKISYSSVAFDVALQTDGKIVAGGVSAGISQILGFAVVRLNGDSLSTAKTSNENFSAIQKSNDKTSGFVFPNPVKDLLQIKGLSSAQKTIKIIDSKGKLLQQATSANNNYSFNVNQLSKGMYFVRIEEGAKVATLKFVKE